VSAAAATAAAALTFVLVSLCVSERAEGDIYWANPAPYVDSIGRANLDGTGVDESFITAMEPSAIAVDSSHLYWGHEVLSISRADLDGSNPVLPFAVTGSFGSPPAGLTVGPGHVYWATYGPGINAVARAEIDGTDIDQTFIDVADGYPGGVAVDDQHVFWTNPVQDAIGRADLDGTDIDQSFITGAYGVSGLAVADGRIYWANYNANTIGTATVDGTDVDQSFITGAKSPSSVAAAGGHVYWTNAVQVGFLTQFSIGRANADGTAVDQGLISGDGRLSGIAVSDPPAATPADSTPPQTTITKRAPNNLGRGRYTFRFTSSERDSTFECRLERKGFAPCSSPQVVRHLHEGKHRFRVVATDAAGNRDPTAAKDRFKVVD